ncbi:MAG: class I SAM-dependent methyltransferase [Thermoplasmatota archaeon]
MIEKGSEWYKQKEVANHYDRKRFEQGGKVLDKKEKTHLLSLIEPKNKHILDIATGTGRFAELLVSEGAKVVGIDASKNMLTTGRAQYLVGDALKLPFKDKSFDYTISMRFFHLLKSEQINDFIIEVKRVTRNKFVFESLHPMSLRILYQWALPQNSHMYSNSFLKDKFASIPGVKKVEWHKTFAVPYGIYQCLPMDLAEKISEIDEDIVDKYGWTASTVYWELSFE